MLCHSIAGNHFICIKVLILSNTIPTICTYVTKRNSVTNVLIIMQQISLIKVNPTQSINYFIFGKKNKQTPELFRGGVCLF